MLILLSKINTAIKLPRSSLTRPALKVMLVKFAEMLKLPPNKLTEEVCAEGYAVKAYRKDNADAATGLVNAGTLAQENCATETAGDQ
jgi:predicted HTH domain antitoxin